MRNVLIIQANYQFAPNMGGELNKIVVKKMEEILKDKGYNVTINDITKGYDPKEEVKKISNNDYIIFQYPIWWFNTPWELKKWVDIVFMNAQGILWENDGRTSSNPNKKYGSGGLTNKKYMLSTTWNAPKEAFSPDQFLINEDYILSNMHKACQFLGMTKIDSFMCNDVVKNPNMDYYLKSLQEHLDKLF
ncbi:MAG: NAD(P)H-dependent oxidoreductase [Mycoplasma sp.]|nr:NAD(P)H-dependent oxidoreductase [Mycoplasma sp.]